MPESSPEQIAENGDELDVKDPAAESSPADEGAQGSDEQGDHPDMLSAVKAALDPEKEEPPASGDEGDSTSSDPKSEKEGSGEESDEDDEGDDELTDEELARLKPRTQKRIQRLLADRSERDQQIAEFQPKAEQFDRMVSWIQDAELTTQDVNLLFDVGKDLRQGNLRQAYEKIAPIYGQLQQALGETLPDDLQQRVSRGEIDQASAQRLAAAEADRTLATQQAERVQQRQQADQQRQAQESHVTAVKDAITTWEGNKSQSDPDWKLKQRQVSQAIQLAIHTDGFPKTVQDAVNMAEAAATQVDKDLRQFMPKKREVVPPPDAGSSRTEVQPKSMLDAAKAGLAAARGG